MRLYTSLLIYLQHPPNFFICIGNGVFIELLHCLIIGLKVVFVLDGLEYRIAQYFAAKSKIF